MRPAFDFTRPFAFVFEDPEWVQKILLGGVFVLAAVVIVGIFFVYGYLARLVRNVIADSPQPLPAWDDLSEYFSEGLRLCAVAVVYTLPIIVLAVCFVFPMVVLQSTGSETIRNISGMMFSCVWCLVLPFSFALAIWLPAALIMTAVEFRFSAGFEFTRIWNFIRANAGNYVLAVLVYLVARLVVPFGFALFCVGIVFTGFWSLLVGAYAFAQTYRLSPVK